MYWKLVDDNSGKIICRSVICSATKPGSANLQVDPIKPLPKDAIIDIEEDTMLDKFMSFANFKTPLSHRDEEDPVDSIPVSTKWKAWQEIEKDEQEEHHEDTQQCHFHSEQPKSNP